MFRLCQTATGSKHSPSRWDDLKLVMHSQSLTSFSINQITYLLYSLSFGLPVSQRKSAEKHHYGKVTHGENLSDASTGFADGWEGFRRAGAGQTPRHREGTATERKRDIALTLDPRLRPRGGTESVDLPAAPFRGGPCRPTSTPSLTSSRSSHRVQCKHAGKGGGSRDEPHTAGGGCGGRVRLWLHSW